MNKYQKHYQSSQTSDLLRKFLEHKLQTQPLGKDWAEALVAVLYKHNLQGKYREVFSTIQDNDPVQLGEIADKVQEKIDALIEDENRNNPFEIDPMKIAEAGRTMKMMARIIGVFLIASVITGIILSCDVDRSTTRSLVVILGISGILANITFLGLTFSTGSILQESVRRKNQ